MPYFSFVIDRKIDCNDEILVYILFETVLRELYPNAEKGLNWTMTRDATDKYRNHPNVYRWEATHGIKSWWLASAG